MGLRGKPVIALVALALAGLASACTSAEPGTPAPTSGSSSVPTVPPPGSTTSAVPTAPVPNPVDLASVKPCSLFTSAVSTAAQTGGDGGKLLETDESSLPGAKGCFQVNGKANVGLTVAVAPNTDINSYSKSRPGQVQQFTAGGYPAIVIAPTGVPACFGGIGVADHQMVYLRYGLANPTSSPRVSQDELCSRLRPVAEQVVAKLTA
jgi:hypothetical protein